MNSIPAGILVIDDEIGMREGCRRALTPHGYQVATAEHGAGGLRQLREGSFDLVLLDAMMPGMSGLELLQHIRQHDPDITCVMITGYATVDLAAQAVKQGAHDFLPKPFTADELLEVVQRGLKERHHRLELKQQREKDEEFRQLEQAHRETAKLDAIESRFMLVLVHELRNPAGVLKSYLQLIRSGYVDDDELPEIVETMDLRAGQLLNMLDDLLELAHLKQAPDPSKLVPVDVAGTIEEAVAKLRPVAEEKRLTVELHVAGTPAVLAQPANLRSLWLHLVDNAIRYTPDGHLTITVTVQSGMVVSSIADTGIGISTDELTRIFQEFYRSEAAQAQEALGTGLGLPIVNQIVKNYQGAIEVDSSPGSGSTFIVSFPAAALGKSVGM